jgi:hypothetical protein
MSKIHSSVLQTGHRRRGLAAFRRRVYAGLREEKNFNEKNGEAIPPSKHQAFLAGTKFSATYNFIFSTLKRELRVVSKWCSWIELQNCTVYKSTPKIRFVRSLQPYFPIT